MLHEIILSLSGHPSPLLTNNEPGTISSILSPSEKALLASVAHLSDVHCKLIAQTSDLSATHASPICKAVATSIKSTHLAKFQQKVLEVEDGILRKDAGSVGAYNIVPLTAVVGEFSGWTRRMEWLLDISQFMMPETCTGAQIVNKLRGSIQTGYSDIEEVALHLVEVAEVAWLKQAASWILYGHLPSFGQEDFFIRRGSPETDDYEVAADLLPNFVTGSTGASMLFIGTSLNHIRTRDLKVSGGSLGLLPLHLKLLKSLTHPITSPSFSSVISAIRLSLSQTALQQLLPLSRILEILTLLHDFFLLERGEFAITLITEADEKIRSRWRRSNNLAYEKRDKMTDIVVKDGEVSAILARTWIAMFSLQGMKDDEDDQLELARDLIYLNIVKSSSFSPMKPSNPRTPQKPTQASASASFNSLLLSVPVSLQLRIPPPLDLFLSPSDIQVYTSINAYLLSIRRAHLRLTDLWKITSLRRSHPTLPPSSTARGLATVHKLRLRTKTRSATLRPVWATSSAALFLLGSAETYFQGEVIKSSWARFHHWLTATPSPPSTASKPKPGPIDFWTHAGQTASAPPNSHDPQMLSAAHKAYLTALTHSLLLTTPTFTTPLYTLLVLIDHLVALVHRIHTIWASLDLENDEGVVDAFSDFRKEEKDVEVQLHEATRAVKRGIADVVRSLRALDGVNEMEDLAVGGEGVEEGQFRPGKVGRVDRLLMKLDFGGWFDGEEETGQDNGSVDVDVDGDGDGGSNSSD